MSSLESRIDALFKGPLDAFVSARAELATSLTGHDARRVKALKKPTVVPWAVEGETLAIWVAREAYEFEPNRKVLDAAANVAHSAESADPLTPPAQRGRAFEAVVHTLTPREHEIILQLLVGRRVDSIAQRLEISSSTVRNHLKSIFRKLEVHSQREAIDRFHEIRAAAAVDAPS